MRFFPLTVRNAIRPISQVAAKFATMAADVAAMFVTMAVAWACYTLLLPLVGFEIAVVATTVVASVFYNLRSWWLKKPLDAVFTFGWWVGRRALQWVGPWPIVIAVFVMMVALREFFSSPLLQMCVFHLFDVLMSLCTTS
jgi:hypothetical protein